MLSAEFYEEKLAEIEKSLERQKQFTNESSEEYIALLKRWRKLYTAGYEKAKMIPKEPEIEYNERTAYRRKEFEKTAHELRGVAR